MYKYKPKNNKKGYRFLLSLNEEQKKAKTEIYQNTISTIIGKAGSGKTLLACQIALHQLLEKDITKKKKIINSTLEINFINIMFFLNYTLRN